MKKILRHFLVALGILILVAGVAAGGYIAYMQAQYYRIEDHLALPVERPVDDILCTETPYTAVSYNIGFGAYGPDYSFFMDTGALLDGTPTQGQYGKAISRDAVLCNTSGALHTLCQMDADFYLLQEVDEKADRSYHVNERLMAARALPGYSRVWAENFHSAYLAYPLHDPHGAVQAGLASFSRYQVNQAVRRSYPVDESFFVKFTDLDRCFTLLRLPVEGQTGQLVLINSHMSAYDEGGVVRARQLKLLNQVIQEEYKKGNYVIVGGDFNHALYGTGHAFACRQQYPAWVQDMGNEDLPDHFSFVVARNGTQVPTCRGADIPYQKGVNYVTVVDGFLVSDNVHAEALNVDTDFLYSDHNPVLLTFTLCA